MTSEELKELLHYDPETGVFTWKVGRKGKAQAGSVAGCVGPQGYIRIKIKNKIYLAHRLAWFYTYGRWPIWQLDHINGIRHDNSSSNLREATQSENSQNSKKRTDNTSGYTGVSIRKGTDKWRAYINIKGKRTYIGDYITPELAYKAYLKAKANLHKFQPIPREV